MFVCCYPSKILSMVTFLVVLSRCHIPCKCQYTSGSMVIQHFLLSSVPRGCLICYACIIIIAAHSESVG